MSENTVMLFGGTKVEDSLAARPFQGFPVASADPRGCFLPRVFYKKNETTADHRVSHGCLCPGRQQLESSGGLKLLKGSEVIQLFAVKRQE